MNIEWLKAEMKEKGIRAKDFTKLVGLDDAQISRSLSGARKFSSEEADSIRRFLGYALPEDVEAEGCSKIWHAVLNMNAERRKALEIILCCKEEIDDTYEG